MQTYIVFFGKSQDFTSYFFDKNGIVVDFNRIIKDFDLLESKLFTVDDINNREILARYKFVTNQGKPYSLLKLYSLAQAYSGSRISGSIYGVAILSEGDIAISRTNLDLLQEAKKNLAKLSLNGLKFNKSNFLDDATRIWKAIVNAHYFDQFDLAPISLHSNAPIAFHVDHLFESTIDLKDKLNNQNIVYFSEDLEHLKRTQKKWGASNFPIYWKQGGNYVEYKEPQPVAPQPTPHQGHRVENTATQAQNIRTTATPEMLRIQLSDAKVENERLVEEHQKMKKTLTARVNILAGMVLLLGVLCITFFFKDSIFTSKPVSKSTSKVEAASPERSTSPTQSNIPGGHSADHRFRLDDLQDCLRDAEYIDSFDPQKNKDDISKLEKTYEEYDRKAQKLGIKIIGIDSNVVKQKIEQCKSIAPKETNHKDAKNKSPKQLPKDPKGKEKGKNKDD
jgi:hypothetical protein